jgi:hypothetical protein
VNGCRSVESLMWSARAGPNVLTLRYWPSNEQLQLSRSFELKYPRLDDVRIRHVFCAPGWARN